MHYVEKNKEINSYLHKKNMEFILNENFLKSI